MSLLFKTLFSWKCKGTHHKLALEALRLVESAEAPAWMNLFLVNIEAYLDGSKAPDDKFKDFRNHVLHVRENYWGGAIQEAKTWFQRAVELLREQKWPQGIYATGVLSHYFTDPHMPFHTGQSEAEGVVHRAAEWSVAKSYDALMQLLHEQLGGMPRVAIPDEEDWLGALIRAGATEANGSYQVLIDHYNLAVGVKDPPGGLDQECRTRLAPLLGRAAAGFARVLERMIQQAGVKPPAVRISLEGVLAKLTVPIFAITKGLADRRNRAQVEAIFKEVQATGKAIESLPEDDKLVRRLHAEEVLKRPLAELDKEPIQPTGTKHAGHVAALAAQAASMEKAAPTTADQPPPKSPTSKGDKNARYFLNPEQPVVDAPTIGPKTAAKLAKIKVRTVGDLLKFDPDQAAEQMKDDAITAEDVADWQDQATLVCRVPGLRGHDAQILVACNVRDPEALAAADAAGLTEEAAAFVGSAEGKRLLRNAVAPARTEVDGWIAAAGQARALRAA